MASRVKIKVSPKCSDGADAHPASAEVVMRTEISANNNNMMGAVIRASCRRVDGKSFQCYNRFSKLGLNSTWLLMLTLLVVLLSSSAPVNGKFCLNSVE